MDRQRIYDYQLRRNRPNISKTTWYNDAQCPGKLGRTFVPRTKKWLHSKSKENFRDLFCTVAYLEKQFGMTTVEIGWDHSIIILLKTEGKYEGDASDKYESLKAKVKLCFEDMFCLNGKVSVDIQNLTTYGIFIHFFSFIKYITLLI